MKHLAGMHLKVGFFKWQCALNMRWGIGSSSNFNLGTGEACGFLESKR